MINELNTFATGNCHQQLKVPILSRSDLDIAAARATLADPYKAKIHIRELIDIDSFRRINELGVMHEIVTFIEYSGEAQNAWNFGNYVFPHKDGQHDTDFFSASLVVPMANYQTSMIRWFEEATDEPLRSKVIKTGRFLANFEDQQYLRMVDFYVFDSELPLMFKVDTWHDIVVPLTGRKLLRWLFRRGLSWEEALTAFAPFFHESKPVIANLAGHP